MILRQTKTEILLKIIVLFGGLCTVLINLASSNNEGIMHTLFWGIVIYSFLSFTKYKDNRVQIVFLIVVIVLLMGTANFTSGQNTDYYGYKQLYDSAYNISNDGLNSFFSSDVGYQVLMKIGHTFGLSYNEFATCIGLVSVALITLVIKTLCNNCQIPLVLYMVYPLTYDVIQIRFLLAYAIVLYGFGQYIKYKSSLKFTVCILISSCIHFSALFFFIFLLGGVFRNIIQKFYKFVIAGVVLLITGIYAFGFNALSFFAVGVIAERASAYTTMNVRISPLVTLYIAGMQLYAIFVFGKLRRTNPSAENSLAFLFNIISLCFVSLIPISLEFERYLRPLLIINSSLIIANREYIKTTTYTRLIVCTAIIYFLRLSVMFDLTNNMLISNYLFEYIFGIK